MMLGYFLVIGARWDSSGCSPVLGVLELFLLALGFWWTYPVNSADDLRVLAVEKVLYHLCCAHMVDS
jgi:ABC-type transport system involved in cytochrome c biogenesis permease subunit